MSEPTESHAPNFEHIQSSKIAIMLPTAQAIDDRFNTENIYSLAVLDSSHAADFPEIVESLNLEATCGNPELMPLVSGSFDIARSAVENNLTAWPNGFLSTVKSRLEARGYIINESQLDKCEFYVPIDDHGSIRVNLRVEHWSIIFSVELVRHSDETEEQETPPLTPVGHATVRAAEILAVGIDGCLKTFCAKKKYSHDIIVDATMPTSSEVFSDKAPTNVHFMGKSATFLSNLETPTPPELVVGGKRSGLDNVGGAYVPKQVLTRLAETFLHPKVAALYGAQPSHFILHGPPGTGKTSLASGFAEMIGAKFQQVPSTDIVDKWVGSSAKRIQEIFDDAYSSDGPVVLFFDELDGWATDQSSSEAAQALRIFQQQFNGRLSENPHIVVAAATNHDINDLPPALVRSGRLKPIDVPKPTEQERCDIWLTLLQEYHMRFEIAARQRRDIDSFNPISDLTSSTHYEIQTLSRLTADYTGSDIRQMIENALNTCFERHLATGQSQSLTQEVLAATIERFHR